MEHGDYALLFANGMSWTDILNLHAHNVAEEIRDARFRNCWLKGDASCQICNPEVS